MEVSKNIRCKHGLTEITCAYCQGYKPPKSYKKPPKSSLYMNEEQFNRCWSYNNSFGYNIGGKEMRFEEC